MGRTHEALIKAERELEKKQGRVTQEPDRRVVPMVPTTRLVHNGNPIEAYRGLKSNLLTHWNNGSKKTLMFVGSSPGDGVTTTGLNFAIVLAQDTKKKVLFIDTNVRTPSLHQICNIESSPGVTDLSTDLEKAKAGIKKFGPWELFVLPCGGNKSDPIPLFESTLFVEFMDSMRAQFDYIIIDTPPASRFLESRVFCSHVDGVVLVIHYSKTRRQAAMSIKKDLEEAGANILGVVVNKMRFYIPEWLYKRL
jgi:capsular exopolysaccharide synthesis family protein